MITSGSLCIEYAVLPAAKCLSRRQADTPSAVIIWLRKASCSDHCRPSVRPPSTTKAWPHILRHPRALNWLNRAKQVLHCVDRLIGDLCGEPESLAKERR